MKKHKISCNNNIKMSYFFTLRFVELLLQLYESASML